MFFYSNALTGIRSVDRHMRRSGPSMDKEGNGLEPIQKKEKKNITKSVDKRSI